MAVVAMDAGHHTSADSLCAVGHCFAVSSTVEILKLAQDAEQQKRWTLEPWRSVRNERPVLRLPPATSLFRSISEYGMGWDGSSMIRFGERFSEPVYCCFTDHYTLIHCAQFVLYLYALLEVKDYRVLFVLVPVVGLTILSSSISVYA
uniref:Uncharacterized protein n=1 Tax=Oryza brachyantha TaxID=4533 RepID=J3MTX0_ORYBR